MLAIHNQFLMVRLLIQAANAFAKLSKCQQFTTVPYSPIISRTLQTLLQSYQNVSNSQPKAFIYFLSSCCKRFCKVIKMLAIHNCRKASVYSFIAANAFAKLSKCQQFTTISRLSKINLMLQTLLQSYQNVSNSQLKASKVCCNRCCKRFCKVIKMLAIHNVPTQVYCGFAAANAFAKLSKCQQFTT